MTVKLQRKMVTGVKTNLQLGFCDVFYFVGCLTVEVNCCILVATSRFVHALRFLASLDGVCLLKVSGGHSWIASLGEILQPILVEADWGL